MPEDERLDCPVTIQLTPELRHMLEALAAERRRTLSDMGRLLLEAALRPWWTAREAARSTPG